MIISQITGVIISNESGSIMIEHAEVNLILQNSLC